MSLTLVVEINSAKRIITNIPFKMVYTPWFGVFMGELYTD